MSQQNSYTSDNIKTMNHIDHIRNNKGLYIGECVNPNHLLYEALDNALDEAQSGNASLIGVIIDQQNGIATIADNGRGIPIDNNTIKTITSEMFSSGKFDKGSDKSYKISIGQHGIGLCAVNALSDYLEVQVYRDDKHAHYRFEHAKSVKEDIVNHKFKVGDKKPFSTQITFKVTKEHFHTNKFDLNDIRTRMSIASMHIEHLKLVLITDESKEIIKYSLDKFVDDHVLAEKYTPTKYSPKIELIHKIKDEQIHLCVFWDLINRGQKIESCVNMKPVDKGTHINYLYDVIRNSIFSYAEKEKIKIEKNDCLVGLRGYLSMMKYKTDYADQTKQNFCTIKKDLDYLFDPIEKQLTEYLKTNDELKSFLLNHFASYRRKLNHSGNIIKADTSKGVSRFFTSTESKLKDCSSTSSVNTEIIICEGDSAAGGLTSCRNTEIHAILGLKGKVLNVSNIKKDYLKNKEILDIINSIGTGIEPDFNIDGLKYGKVIIATDADSDGCADMSNLIKIKHKKSIKEEILTFEEFKKLHSVDYIDYHIWAYDEEKEKYVWTDILKVWDEKYFDEYVEIEFQNGKITKYSADHPFLTRNRGYVAASDLMHDDDVINENGAGIDSITLVKLNEERPFADISTSTGNYVDYTSGSVVHNSHIYCLLCTLFLKLTPELVKRGHIYKAELPLYGCQIKNKFISLFTKEDADKFRQQSPRADIRRYKGLGEMNPDQLGHCLLDKTNRKIRQLKYPDNADDIFKLMSDSTLKRDLITGDDEE